MTQPKNPKRYQIFVGEQCVVNQPTPITQGELRDVIHEYNAHIVGHVANTEYERYSLQRNVLKGKDALKEFDRLHRL